MSTDVATAEAALADAIAQAAFMAEHTMSWDDLHPDLNYIKDRYLKTAWQTVAIVRAAGWRPGFAGADEPVLEWATMEPFRGLVFWPTEAEAREYAEKTEHCNLYSRVRWWAHATDWELR